MIEPSKYRSALMIAIMIIGPLLVSAQGKIHLLQLTDGSTIVPAAQKHVKEFAAGFDPSALVSFQTDKVKLKFSTEVDPDELRTGLNSLGIGTFEHVQRPDEMLPQKNNTGNDEQDELDYRKAKEEWIERDPDRYEKLTGGSETGTAPSQRSDE